MALEAEGSNPSIHLDCQILMQICVGIFYNLYIHIRRQQTLNEEFVSAGMAELADAPDLGSGVHDVQVQVLLPAVNECSCKSMESILQLFFYARNLLKYFLK